MADLPTEFWGGYIAGITIVSLSVLAWLIYNVYFSGGSDPELADHVWDDDLREGSNPAPLWWFWMILAALIFSVIYLLLYPGLGTFRGALDWSQGGEVRDAQLRYDEQFGAERSRIALAASSALAAEPMTMSSGAHLFKVHCSACHGVNAQGQASLFPNLSDAAWQWGGSEAQIEQTLRMGRNAVMPPWQAVLQDEGVAALTDYVRALAEGRDDSPDLADGRTRFGQFCAACHGPDGSGNALLGAPALNDAAWLYGGTYDDVYASIAAGRNGVMPAFGARLDTTQIKLLTAWLAAGAPGR